MKFARIWLGAFCFASGIAVSFVLAQTAYPPLQVLLSSGQSILGQDIVYPAGKPNITAAVVTIQPQESTGWHLHEAPLFAMILDGELTVDYGNGATRHYVKDDTFIEAFKSRHNGTNTGSTPVRILVVFAGSDAVKNTVKED
jgi:quercetin dioxygenase-like cupin family protein